METKMYASKSYSDETLSNLYSRYENRNNKSDYILDGDRHRIVYSIYYDNAIVVFKKNDKKNTSKKAKSLKHKKSDLKH